MNSVVKLYTLFYIITDKRGQPQSCVIIICSKKCLDHIQEATHRQLLRPTTPGIALMLAKSAQSSYYSHMTRANKKIITINWQALGSSIISIIKFVKWPLTLFFITYLLLTVPNYAKVDMDWELILKYINVLIWPLVIVGALWFIKPNLPNLLDRLEELNLLGNNAKFAKRQNQVTETQADELKELDPDASKVTTKTLADFQIADDETHILLTSYNAAIAYVQVYADIFGTQIYTLRTLLDYKDGLKASDLSTILEDHKRLSSNKGHASIVSFMQFLVRNTLAIHNPTTQVYQLTNAGYYFLVFLYKAELLDRSKSW